MKKFNLNIQGMRGVCALMVFGGHVTAAFDNPWLYSQYNPLRALLDGHAAVMFFFLLSGYFYYTDQCISVKKYTKLLAKRVMRLTPPVLDFNHHRGITLQLFSCARNKCW